MSQTGGADTLTYDQVVNASVVKPLLEGYYKNLKEENMPDDKQEIKKANLENKINTYIDEVNNGKITKEVAMKMVERTLRGELNLSTDLSDSESDESDNEGDNEGDKKQETSQAIVEYKRSPHESSSGVIIPEGSKISMDKSMDKITLPTYRNITQPSSNLTLPISSQNSQALVPTSSSNTTLTQSSSNPSQETSQALVLPGSKNSNCIYKEAPQCDSTKSKDENERILNTNQSIRSSEYFNPADNRGCDPNLNYTQIYEKFTGPAYNNTVLNCERVLRSQETITNETETGPEQNTALKAITDGSTESQQTVEGQREGEEVITNESGPQQTSSTPVLSNTEISNLIELLKKLASQDKIPKVSFDNNELRIVSASSADQDKQLGDQPVIEVDLTESGKQLNIKYLKEDNTEDTIKIVLYGPQTDETKRLEELRLENLQRMHA